MIAEEKESAAVELIGAGAGDHVDGSRRDRAGGQIEVERADLEFLDAFRGEVLRRAAGGAVIHSGSVKGDRGHGLRRAGDAHLEEVVRIARAGVRSVGDGNARLESGDGEETSPVERQILHPLAVDNTAQRGIGSVHGGGYARHFDGLAGGSEG